MDSGNPSRNEQTLCVSAAILRLSLLELRSVRTGGTCCRTTETLLLFLSISLSFPLFISSSTCDLSIFLLLYVSVVSISSTHAPLSIFNCFFLYSAIIIASYWTQQRLSVENIVREKEERKARNFVLILRCAIVSLVLRWWWSHLAADLVVVFDDYSSFFLELFNYYALLERDEMNGIGKIKRDELFTVSSVDDGERNWDYEMDSRSVLLLFICF